MTINAYEKGDAVRIAGAFTDQLGAALDPSVILFTYKNPAGTSVTLTYGVDGALVRASAGNYRVDIDAATSGMWHWRWHSTGSGQAADEGQFYVKPSAV